MAIGNRIKNLFRKITERDLATEESRSELIAQKIQETKRLAEQGNLKQEEVRAPLLELIEAYIEFGKNETEVLRAAEKAIEEDPYWLTTLTNKLLSMPHVPQEDLSLLEREARNQGRNISLWRRYVEEHHFYANKFAILKAREIVTLNLSNFFPANEDSRWYDIETESEARLLFQKSLKIVLDHILDDERVDGVAEAILRIAADHYPDEGRIRTLLAHFAKARGTTDADSLSLVLEALVTSPDDMELKHYAGSMLANRNGHEAEGFDLLYQVYQDRPNDVQVLRQLVEIALRTEEPQEPHFEVVAHWFKIHEDDHKAADFLADWYSVEHETTPEALRAYAATSPDYPNRRDLTLLVAKSYTEQENWEEAGKFYQELYNNGDESREVVVPLGWAYSTLERYDEQAATVYLHALEYEIQPIEVHDLLCRYLYENKCEDPASIKQFEETLSTIGYCLWAELGLIKRDLRDEEFTMALEHTTMLLSTNSDNTDLMELAAEALAGNSRRQQLRLVMELPPETAMTIFERAIELQPDSLLLMTTLARYRLAKGIKLEDTARLLGEICRRDYEEIELRIARANILYDLGQKHIAAQIYRDVLDRTKGSGHSARSSSTARISDEERIRIRNRAIEILLAGTELDESDADFLIDLALQPDIEAEDCLRIAHAVAQTPFSHTARLALLERALMITPNDMLLSEVAALDLAERGNPRKALNLALNHLRTRDYSPKTVDLFQAALSSLKKEHVTTEHKNQLLRLVTTTSTLPKELIVEIARVLSRGEVYEPMLHRVYEKASMLAPDDDDLALAIRLCE